LSKQKHVLGEIKGGEEKNFWGRERCSKIFFKIPTNL